MAWYAPKECRKSTIVADGWAPAHVKAVKGAIQNSEIRCGLVTSEMEDPMNCARPVATILEQMNAARLLTLQSAPEPLKGSAPYLMMQSSCPAKATGKRPALAYAASSTCRPGRDQVPAESESGKDKANGSWKKQLPLDLDTFLLWTRPSRQHRG